MVQEIECKFLVECYFLGEIYNTPRIVQWYICFVPERMVRVRIHGDKGYLTIKDPSDTKGLSRYEFEKK